MSQNSNDERLTEEGFRDFPLSQDRIEFYYDVHGDRLEPSQLEADPAIIQFKDGTTLPESDPDVRTYEGGTGEASRLYSWTGREMDVEAALRYNRVRSTPDPTVGRFIEEEPDSNASQASDR